MVPWQDVYLFKPTSWWQGKCFNCTTCFRRSWASTLPLSVGLVAHSRTRQARLVGLCRANDKPKPSSVGLRIAFGGQISPGSSCQVEALLPTFVFYIGMPGPMRKEIPLMSPSSRVCFHCARFESMLLPVGCHAAGLPTYPDEK